MSLSSTLPDPARLLICGTCWLPAADSDRLWLARQWIRLARLQDPTARLLLVDSDSPGTEGLQDLVDQNTLVLRNLGDNIGHLGSTGRDGWGRAAMAALDYACTDSPGSAESAFDWIAFWDADVLMLRSAGHICAGLATAGRPAASVVGRPYHWLEGIFFFHVPWLRTRGLQGHYNWPSVHRGIFPEHRMQEAIGPDLTCLDLAGIRDDHSEASPQTLQTLFGPAGPDYLTHSNRETYEAALALRGLQDPAAGQTSIPAGK